MESAPLLAASGLPGPNVLQDHPAFLRASHSPWSFIPQNVLVILRGTILVYLIATAVMIADYKFTEEIEYSQWGFFFDFALISAFLVLIYHLVTFSWTFTHLYYPNLEEIEGGIESWIVKIMSLPSNMGSLRRQFRFTMFYTTTVVFSFMNTALYWFITRQHEGGDGDGGEEPAPEGDSLIETLIWPMTSLPVTGTPFSDLFGEGWFKPFVIFNLYGIYSVLMVIEILLFNSIKRPFAIGYHLFGLIFFSGLYLGWAAIGKTLTDWYPFFWLDEAEVGSQEAVIFYSIGFVLLAPISWIFMQGFVGVRETMTRPRLIVQESPLES
ncbi:hypothetical protein PT974_02112 [Cladobotryum mycophilum]|uniref:Uncharacterized protein n=1 Tax=Cladobotryum mycophilum TaxID=491253 RepID=A0ABR0SYC6_9HYPO